ncbi:hypothetical protein B0H16DRAFT_1452956 [Mycena metata]|uniref:Uncharacterized protein n=1 Tax=Mycena metata TaxID=1033252 RepID=A0AAD7JMQ5_9AGAR|nr:hypothetical protein B0H16DRAFT_1452956 [Mycena metata]
MRFRAFDCGSAGPVAVLCQQAGDFARLSNGSPSVTTEMPRTTKGPSHTQRGATGAFTSNQPAQQSPPSDTEEPDDTPPTWEDSDSEDEDYTEEWQTLPRPITYDERQEIRLRQRIMADEKRRKAEMRGAEQRLAGPVDNQTGKRRGPYNVGGMSKRSSQGKRKQLKSDFEGGKLKISAAEFQRQMAALEPKAAPSTGKQATLNDMFKKRPRSPSPSPDYIEINDTPPHSPAKRQRPDNTSGSALPGPIRPTILLSTKRTWGRNWRMK